MIKCQKHPTCGIFLKRGLFKGIKNDNPRCQTRKYKNTNTQIYHMVRCQKDPTCCIFLKRGLFKGIKNDIPMRQTRKYKNTNTQNMPHVGSFWHFAICCICVFVYLCICIFVFARLTHGNIIFDTLEQSPFQKYATCWVFLALRHMLHLCTCICSFDRWEYHF